MKKCLFDFVKDNKSFIFILLLGLALRVALISQNPPSLNWDEVSHGYNAYSILKTGKDEWGQVLPIIFRAYGDYKLPVYIYLTALSEAFFGLNAFSVRLPSIVAGVATVLFTYLLAKKLFGKRVGIISSLLVAIEPWSLFLSRGAFEANLALALMISGIYFFLKGIHNSKFFIHASILLGLSVWTYNSARIFVPLFLLLLGYLYKEQIQSLLKQNRTIIVNSLFIILIFFLPMFWQLLSPEGLARYGKVSILDEGAIAQINEARVTSELSPFLARAVHNKATFFGQRFVKNWVSHFSGSFLFTKGGSHFQFSIPGYGLLYSVNALFLIIGIFYLVKRRSKASMLILGWLILGPVASSLTREAPHVLRSITMLPTPMVITSVGVWRILEWLKQKKLKIENKQSLRLRQWNLKIPLPHIVMAIYLVVLAGFLENYFIIYMKEYRNGYSWAWQYGYQQVVDFSRLSYENYDRIIVSKKYGEPHEFFLFFWPWDPKAYQEDKNLLRFYQSDWYWVDRFDKFYFVNDWQIPRTQNEDFVLESGGTVPCSPTTEHCLLITSPGNFPDGWNKIKTINFLDNKPAFEIYAN